MKLISRTLVGTWRSRLPGTPPDMWEVYTLDSGQRVEVNRGSVWRNFPQFDQWSETPLDDLEASLMACRELDASLAQLDEWHRDAVDSNWRARISDDARRQHDASDPTTPR